FYEDMLHASMLGKHRDFGNYNKIVFCGIGGSEIPGEIVKCLNLKIPVLTAKQELPNCIDRKTLCIVISYSGNTKETIKLYNQVRKKTSKILIVTSGGKLGNLKEKKILIPEDYIPRGALAYLLFPVLNVLKINYQECFKIIKNHDKEIREKSRELAHELRHRIPVIYVSGENLRCIGKRWTKELNENSKTFAHANFYPEVFHNEIEIHFNSHFFRILLYDREDKLSRKASKMFNTHKVRLHGKSLIARIIYGMYLGWWTSYYLAEISGIHYWTNNRIDELKR
ncbi:SIS domain-containing protein, partial [Candidatus Pacearchaeota archaeon]|nr:SIS domain-containing protein [Candidatus Pacearchaeota archaeon]MBD3282836.1 SIS domain-containing protein [Candidatus Pacearchaeota archaeon]